MATKEQALAIRTGIGELDLEAILGGAEASNRFKKIVLTTLSLNTNLYNCDRRSLMSSCMKAAADGLVLDGREAAIITFRAKNGPNKAQYIPMVAGVIKKVRQSGEVSVFNAQLVYENDKFKAVYGLNPTLEHEPLLDGERGAVRGCYAVCRFKDGNSDYEYMTKADIEAIRNRGKARNSGPWATDWGEMARKTLLHRLAKRLPMATDAQNTMSRIEDLYDLDSPDPNYVEPTTKKRGAGAAALNDADGDADDGIIDIDEDGNIVGAESEGAAEEEPEPAKEEPKPRAKAKPVERPADTPAQKKARAANKRAAEAKAAAEAAEKEAAEAEEEANGNAEPPDESGDEDLL